MADADTRRTVALEGRATAMSSGRASLAAGAGKFDVAGFDVGTFGGGSDGPPFGFAEAVKGEGESKAPSITETGTREPRVFNESVVEAAEARDTSNAEVTPDLPPARRIKLNWDEPIVGTADLVEENDTLEAQGTATAGAEVKGVGASVDVAATLETIVIPAIWGGTGIDILGHFEEVERNFITLRQFAISLEIAKGAVGRAHNGPPELVDAPEIDIESLDAAISALRILRTQIIKADPDPQLLDLIWRTLGIGARACGKFALWITEKGGSAAARYIDNIFDSASKELGKSLGTPKGLAAWGVFICAVSNGQEKDVKILMDAVKLVAAALGHPIP